MSELHSETLSAFCDGEIVDPERLRAALTDAQARDALVDFARLRAGVGSAASLPPSLNTLRPSRVPVSGVPRWSALVAALLVLGVLSGALLSRLWTRPADAPPSPTRVVRYVPGVDWHADNR
jgi:hypothetical protein